MTVSDAESGFHVLAVDDSVITRRLIDMLLKTSGDSIYKLWGYLLGKIT